MKAYAADTKVSPEKTRAEIETLLGKHGATRRVIGTDEDHGLARVGFVFQGREYRLDVPLPVAAHPTGRKPNGWYQWGQARREQWMRERASDESRSRWRSVLLLLKAKLELVRLGVSTVEKEFLADMVLANGTTLHIAVAESIKRSLETGAAPVLALPQQATETTP